MFILNVCAINNICGWCRQRKIPLPLGWFCHTSPSPAQNPRLSVSKTKNEWLAKNLANFHQQFCGFSMTRKLLNWFIINTTIDLIRIFFKASFFFKVIFFQGEFFFKVIFFHDEFFKASFFKASCDQGEFEQGQFWSRPVVSKASCDQGKFWSWPVVSKASCEQGQLLARQVVQRRVWIRRVVTRRDVIRRVWN